MSCFPFFTELSGKRGLVAGGGRIAARKVEKLLPFGPKLTVVAPEFGPELSEKEGFCRICRPFLPSDTEGMDFVIGATGDSAVNQEIYEICREKKIPVNVVDDKEKCTFIFPALVKRGDFVAGFTTGGSCPSASRFMREQTEKMLPSGFEEIIGFMGEYRKRVRCALADVHEREQVLCAAFELAMEKGGPLSEEEADALLSGGIRHEK